MSDQSNRSFATDIGGKQRSSWRAWLRLLWPRRTWLRVAILTLLVLCAVIAAMLAANRDRLPKLEEMGIEPLEQTFIPVAEGELWIPGERDEVGFAVVHESERFVLMMEPELTQISVLDKESGYTWRSNPSKEQIAEEKLKGLLLTNLQSPYVMEYVQANKTQRNMVNALDKKLDKQFIRTDAGIEVVYHYTQLDLTLSIRYELTASGLEVTVPTEGIEELGENRIFTLQLLPYFGAVRGAEEEGYLLVPDGPGGLIYYESDRPAVSGRYEYMIYGEDPTSLQERSTPRENIAYPVFGMKRGQQGYAAIIKAGEYTTRIAASPAGIQNNWNSIAAKFVYREEYLRKVSMMATPVSAVQKERIEQDRVVEYRLLNEEAADYSGMAAAYRSYLLEEGRMPERLEAMEHIPLLLGVVGGGTKDVFGGNQYVTATTFEQAGEMAIDLSEAGVASMIMLYQGWQQSGFRETDARFPIQQKLGGAEELKRMSDMLRARGIPLLLEDFSTWLSTENKSIAMRTEGVRSIDTTVLQHPFRDAFLLNPALAVRYGKTTIDKLAALGISGIIYDGIGSTVFRDYGKPSLRREDTAHLYQMLMAYTKGRLGMVGTNRGNSYSLQEANLILDIPMDSSYDYLVDENVPFYPMVLHGSILYTGVEGNLRNEYTKEQLKMIEYGAIPSFTLTHSRSRELKGTDYDDVFSSEFAVWRQRVVEEYAMFDELAALAHQRMVRHSKLADDVYAMEYEDGSRVIINYNDNTVDVHRKGGGR